jgi:hypothetical protein
MWSTMGGALPVRFSHHLHHESGGIVGVARAVAIAVQYFAYAPFAVRFD